MLDSWIEGLPEKPRARKNGIDSLTAPSVNNTPPPTAEERRRASLARL